jgi:hypothetical protein
MDPNWRVGSSLTGADTRQGGWATRLACWGAYAMHGGGGGSRPAGPTAGFRPTQLELKENSFYFPNRFIEYYSF